MAKKSSKKPRPTTRKKGLPKPRRQKAEPSLVLQAVAVKEEPVLSTPSYTVGFFLVLGFLLVVTGVLFLPNFRPLLMKYYLDQYKFLPYAGMIAGFLVLFFCFRRKTPVPPLPDLSRPVAYLAFAFFYFLCFYTRFSHPEVPQATFWFDDLVVYHDIRAIIDWGENYLLFPFGQREPFFPYFTAYLWKLLIPNADGVYADRLSSMLIDMGTCWGFYRLGREIASRWLGLALMALYSVGKPMVIYCFFGYGANTCMLSTVWMAYFFFHLMKNPVFKRFIYLGIAMGFGAFTYVPARPWPPFLIGVVWLWVLWNTRQKPKSMPLKVLLTLGMAFCAFLVVFKNGYLPKDLGWVAFFTHLPVWAAILAVLAVAYFMVGIKSRGDEAARLTFGWATMAMVDLLITLPFYLQEGYASHVVESSALHVDGKIGLGLNVLTKLLYNIHYYFTMMFVQPISDSGTYPIINDSFFDPLPVIGMIIGLAFFLAKPSWGRGFILSLIPVGMVPFVLATTPNSARPLASVIPLLTLAGWGLVYWLGSFVAAVPGKTMRFLALAGLCSLWVWNAEKSNWSVWHGWMGRVSGDQFTFQQVDKDWKQYRVMVAVNSVQFGSAAFTALCDQREVYWWKDSTPLYLGPGETGKDVSLLFWGNDPRKIDDQVRKEFPEAQISTVPGYHEEDANFLKRAVIPFSAILNKTSGMLYPVRVPAGYWRRQFYWEGYGWARGLVWLDDRVPNLAAPLPAETTHYETARADGDLNVPTEGDYQFSGTNGLDFVILLVDGKKIIDYYPSDGKAFLPRAGIHLAPGPHSVTVETYFKNNLLFPKIAVTPPGGPQFILGE